MNEQVTKKRDWIKNAIIVFLVIMLALTFFSNTIMNYSLPEVSAQYTNSGSIQAKVRGSGVVEAGDPYAVKADSSKLIESVAVKNGDHVEKGDVILYLEEGESTELKNAEKTLEQMLDDYRQAALAADIDPETTDKVLNGSFTSYGTFKAQIDALKKEIQALEAEMDLYKAEISKVEAEKEKAEKESSSDSKAFREAYEAAVASRQSAENTLNSALAAAGQAEPAVKDVATAKEALNVVQKDVSEKQKAVNDIQGSLEYRQAEVMRTGYESALTAAQTQLESVIASGTGNEFINGTDGQTKIEAAQAAWEKAENDLNSHMQSTVYQQLNTAKEALAAVQQKQGILEAVIQADSNLTAAKTQENSAWKAYENAGPDRTSAISGYVNVININQDYINELSGKISEKQSLLNALLTQMSQENSLSDQLEAITEQRELIDKLKGTATGGNITAPIAGTVQNLYLTAGESTTAGNEVAIIAPDGKGYTMEVTVTKEQAQRLNIGDIADIQNSWYYSEVTAVLRQIKADKNNPSTNKILVFQVEGDVTNGQNLSISIGQKSANYDIIVPNSAIREDSNGKFVLIVTQKSSPLGNRYYAERVDVEVLASDDTRSAITGDMTNWEYVITTSTKPIEAGQLIRLAD